VPKAEFARQDWYDVWYPNLAPTVETMKLGLAAESDTEWKRFERQYRKEMSAADARRSIELLAVLSRSADFSVGCYCEDENRCHRSILKGLLVENGADVRE